MTVTTWTVGHTGYCANFTLVLPPNSNLLGGESRQNLEVRNQQIVPAPGTTFLVTNATFIFSQNLPTSSSGSASDADAVPAESDAPLASSASPNSGSSASGTSNKANVIVPAVVVPLVVILIAGAAFVFLWRRRRRSRMAPSAAFRADHPEAIAAVERSGGATSHLSGTGTSFSSTPTPYFPIDEKRSFAP
ncbi:hypothetical protein BKA62DRAFT_33054 [Auriculariales sp. MPI-PUGE-AT-0066]|nr:hypothetical protein BKA62DRAFT_33054 [Auriculariales sp. MPI-PUGE-AT-0066]